MKAGFAVCALITLFTFCFSLEVVGQEKEVSGKEFTSILSNATSKLKDRAYRKTAIQETFGDDAVKPEATRKWVTEVLPPDKERVLFSLKSSSESYEHETIRVGETAYRRFDKGQWQQLSTPPLFGRGSGQGPSSTRIVYLGKEKVEGREVDKYKQTVISQVRVKGIEKSSITTTIYLLDKDGLLLSEVRESDNVISKRTRVITEYEYNVNLRIEAPIK